MALLLTKSISKERYINVLPCENFDGECLEQKIKEWKKGDNKISVHFRPKISDEGKENEKRYFRFVYQSNWQKYLLNHYDEIILLDAT